MQFLYYYHAFQLPFFRSFAQVHYVGFIFPLYLGADHVKDNPLSEELQKAEHLKRAGVLHSTEIRNLQCDENIWDSVDCPKVSRRLEYLVLLFFMPFDIFWFWSSIA